MSDAEKQMLGWLKTAIQSMAFTILVEVVIAIPVYFLWNWLVPGIFHLREITLLEAWGLAFLAELLFNWKSIGQ